ncbi:hypothetical protein [Haladaptatus sp. DYSN1]|uniref:hypothetical protein n=1 Tax=unclassified Haladaptatus TaxID=2622732 RepID=UPI002404B49A|nr:hypothetical protein [Haladaptatus sp. DYSN1]
MALTFTKCGFIPKVDVDGFSINLDRQEFCYEVSDFISTGTRQCANGSTPPLQSVQGSLFSRQYEDPLSTDPSTATIGFDLAIWIGIEEKPNNNYCLWMGQEETGVCVSSCDMNADGNPALADIRALADALLEELDENLWENKYDILVDVGATVAAGILVAAALWYLGVVLTIAVVGGGTVA